MKKSLIILLFSLVVTAIPSVVLAGQSGNSHVLRISKQVRNISHGGGFAKAISVHNGDIVEFSIVVTAHPSANNVLVHDQFDSSMFEYVSNSLRVDGQPYQSGLSGSGLRFASIGSSPLRITYRGKVSPYAYKGSYTVAQAVEDNGNYISTSSQVNLEAGTAERTGKAHSEADSHNHSSEQYANGDTHEHRNEADADLHSDEHAHDHSKHANDHEEAVNYSTNINKERVHNHETEEHNHDHEHEHQTAAYIESHNRRIQGLVAPETGVAGVNALYFGVLSTAGYGMFRFREKIIKLIFT